MMTYNKIIVRQIPHIAFAHEYKTDRYDLRFPTSDRKMEITFIEQGEVVKTYDNGERYLIGAPSVAVSFFDRVFSMKSEAPLHSHFTVGFDMDFEKHPITKEQVIACSHAAYKQSASHHLMAILPEYFPVNQQNADMKKRIIQIINAHISPGNSRDIRCVGLLFDLLTDITEQSVRDVMAESCADLSPGNISYVRRAMQVISENLHRKITIKEIAGELNISDSYLSNLFKCVTGQTVGGYIIRIKMDRVMEMVAIKHATLREAGESVGIYDENYLSRIFKKHTGLTVREYRKLKTIQ